MNDSLFAHLAGRFNDGIENIATEALLYILSRSEMALQAIHDLIPKGYGVPCPAFADTQVYQDQTFLDLTLFDSMGQPRIILENKFWAGLTANQPVTYLESLEKYPGPTVLLFVAPSRRLATLWEELRRRCSDAETLSEFEQEENHAMRIASVGDGRLLMATDWLALLAAIESALERKGETSLLEDVRQLAGLCHRQDQEAFLPLTSEELTDLGFARRVLNLEDLAHDIAAAIKEAGIGETRGLRVTYRRHQSGQYLHLGRKIKAGGYLCYNPELWLEKGVSPIWLMFSLTEWSKGQIVEAQLGGWFESRPPRAYRIDSRDFNIAIPIRLSADKDKAKLIADAVEQVAVLVEEVECGLPFDLKGMP